MKLMTTNYCSEDATVITASTENSNYPASNLKNAIRAKSWRSTATTTQNIVFDFITSTAIDSVIIMWPKEDGIKLSGTATLRIQANATNIWTSPAVDQALTINDTYELASHYFGVDQSYRYWRVVIADSGNPYGYLEIGKVWIGKALGIVNADNGFKFSLLDGSVSSKTTFGHIYVDEYPQLASLDFQYALLDYTTIQILENAYRECGSKHPVMMVLDPEEAVFNKDHIAIYGLFKPQFSSQHINYNLFSTSSMNITELP